MYSRTPLPRELVILKNASRDFQLAQPLGERAVRLARSNIGSHSTYSPQRVKAGFSLFPQLPFLFSMIHRSAAEAVRESQTIGAGAD